MKQNHEALIAKWIKPAVQDLQSYHVPDAEGLIKLDAMENPYGWSDDYRKQWLDSLKNADINRYPDPHCQLLKKSLRQTLSIPNNLELMLGNGSDELIQIVAMAVARPGSVLLAPEPSFVMYKMISQFIGLEYIGVPLTENFELDENAMLAAIEQHKPAVIFLAYPNNPGGNLFDKKTLNKIIESSEGLVVIDEAYHIFSDASYIADISKYKNVLLMRTLSKVGLAGLRLGYLVGDKQWLDEFDKIRLPYNINVLTQLSAEYFLQHYHELELQADKIISNRQTLFNELDSLEGIEVFPSSANFLLFRCQGNSAEQIFNSLLERGVLIKKSHGSHPLLDQCLRVTVGKSEENEIFVRSLGSALVEK